MISSLLRKSSLRTFSVVRSLRSSAAVRTHDANSNGNNSNSLPVPTEEDQAAFHDSQIAYGAKTTTQLKRALFVLRLCQVDFLVRHSETLMKLGRRVLGDRAMDWIMRETFFGHFCAGEDNAELEKTVEFLRNRRIGAIYDYAAEADVETTHEAPLAQGSRAERRDGVRRMVVSARIYDYKGEKECDDNLELTLAAVREAGRQQRLGVSPGDGFVAVKMTALGKPSLLTRMTKIVRGLRMTWASSTDVKNPAVESLMRDHLSDAAIDCETFDAGLRRLGIDLSKEEANDYFRKLDTDGDGHMDYLEWMGQQMTLFLSADDSPLVRATRAPFHADDFLDSTEVELLSNLIERIECLAQAADENGVHLLVDAEQSYMQAAIDQVVNHLQARHNRTRPVVFNTYQAYLTYSHSHVINDLERARRGGYIFAGKLVRGAYLEQENKLAGAASPIWPNKSLTDRCYNDCIKEIMSRRNQSAHLMVASHNVTSVAYAAKLLAHYQNQAGALYKSNVSHGLYFAQLLGMADYITFSLAKDGHHVYKYCPYGPIKLVSPYLSRRAKENRGVLNTTKEIEMIQNELKRR